LQDSGVQPFYPDKMGLIVKAAKCMKNQVRIIGGHWRGRKLSFPANPELRPTPDRVRETVFNWLSPYIVGARCLELFAGSAAFSFEALSRNAAFAWAVEKDRASVNAIRENARLLKAESLEVVEADCIAWLKKSSTPFDIICVDPPYAAKLLPACFDLLDKNGWLAKDALVYFESEYPIEAASLPLGWQIIKEKRAGQVHYYLVTHPL
jgi:16S rRNA (guanine966-N2)-methyltransferase